MSAQNHELSSIVSKPTQSIEATSTLPNPVSQPNHAIPTPNGAQSPVSFMPESKRAQYREAGAFPWTSDKGNQRTVSDNMSTI